MKNVIQVQQTGDVTVIKLVFNEINLTQREQIKEALQKELAGDRKKFVIDLSRVGFVSSMVLALIVFFSKEVASGGGKLMLCGVSPDAMNVFKVTRLDKEYEFHKTLNEAVGSLKDL